MKFCRDCDWLRVDPKTGINFARCGHESAEKPVRLDLVTGVDLSRGAMRYCSTERLSGCGPEGKNWETK